MNCEETEITWGRVAGRELRAVYYRPVPAESKPEQPVHFAIDIHGGAWSSGHRKDGQYYCRQLAEHGIAVLAIDFRQGPDFQHPAASEDIHAAVQFVRRAAGGLLNLPNIASLGLVGSSSGGHLALLSGYLSADQLSAYGEGSQGATEICLDGHFILPPAPSAETTPEAVDFIIALWPVSNPLARFQYLTARLAAGSNDTVAADLTGNKDLVNKDMVASFQPQRLAEGHKAYFKTEAAMQEAGIQRILTEGANDLLPRTLIVQPALDRNVPQFMNETLHGALIRAGAEVEYRLYPAVAHGFAQAPGPGTDACIADMVAFIQGR